MFDSSLLPRVRSIVFPPRARGLFCLVCFRQNVDVCRFEVRDVAFGVHVMLHALTEQSMSIRALCARCRDAINRRETETLQSIVALEFLGSSIDPRLRASAFIEAEYGLRFAEWWLADVPVGTLSPGLQAWCALTDRYPQDAEAASAAERDFGNGVYAALSTFSGGLWIENLVSRDRRKGFATSALRVICSVADEFGATITGIVEPNCPERSAGDGLTNNGKPSKLPPGPPRHVLLEKYAREGFARLPLREGVVVMRHPRRRHS